MVKIQFKGDSGVKDYEGQGEKHCLGKNLVQGLELGLGVWGLTTITERMPRCPRALGTLRSEGTCRRNVLTLQ